MAAHTNAEEGAGYGHDGNETDYTDSDGGAYANEHDGDGDSVISDGGEEWTYERLLALDASVEETPSGLSQMHLEQIAVVKFDGIPRTP